MSGALELLEFSQGTLKPGQRRLDLVAVERLQTVELVLVQLQGATMAIARAI